MLRSLWLLLFLCSVSFVSVGCGGGDGGTPGDANDPVESGEDDALDAAEEENPAPVNEDA
ncbi:hypothetical protein [Thalassoglobus polymorphus]|uniref:Uncharacterized protein n=1 Tax=Thalassoglobus polymorphus TaxID=2527994 RepID=A0A517QIN9_9PLAN|nr:hypothetical protein [Thalassoglobus polymorphus]QDT31511.1 hypothetical protein Mal48_07450 [Thalassoglobus polymorphus]